MSSRKRHEEKDTSLCRYRNLGITSLLLGIPEGFSWVRTVCICHIFYPFVTTFEPLVNKPSLIDITAHCNCHERSSRQMADHARSHANNASKSTHVLRKGKDVDVENRGVHCLKSMFVVRSGSNNCCTMCSRYQSNLQLLILHEHIQGMLKIKITFCLLPNRILFF